MTYQEIASMIESIGLPFAYYQFDQNTVQSPPFICFYYPAINDVYADASNYQRITELTIELYTDNKDFINEKAIEDVLSASGLTYQKTESYIDEEKMYMVSYEMEVIING